MEGRHSMDILHSFSIISIRKRNYCNNLATRQGNYCNNLATRVIPFFIVKKSSVGKTILKVVLPRFSQDPVA